MKLISYRDDCTDSTIYTLVIPDVDRVYERRATDFDRLLLKESDKSALVSDMLLGLENIARRIETGAVQGVEK